MCHIRNRKSRNGTQCAGLLVLQRKENVLESLGLIRTKSYWWSISQSSDYLRLSHYNQWNQIGKSQNWSHVGCSCNVGRRQCAHGIDSVAAGMVTLATLPEVSSVLAVPLGMVTWDFLCPTLN